VFYVDMVESGKRMHPNWEEGGGATAVHQENFISTRKLLLIPTSSSIRNKIPAAACPCQSLYICLSQPRRFHSYFNPWVGGPSPERHLGRPVLKPEGFG
jgi:hypothetical protein